MDMSLHIGATGFSRTRVPLDHGALAAISAARRAMGDACSESAQFTHALASRIALFSGRPDRFATGAFHPGVPFGTCDGPKYEDAVYRAASATGKDAAVNKDGMTGDADDTAAAQLRTL